MTLCKIKRPMWGGAPERIILEDNLSLGVLVVVHNTVDIKTKEVQIVDDTDSYQIRPKALFKNKKGYYYKDCGTVYLDQKNTNMCDDFLCDNNFIILPKDEEERKKLKEWGCK